ncbi:MAG: helix-turn-helix domain-containing protein, partial [Bilophila sp.]
MSKPQVRKYCSPLREYKANLTRSNIADAAERLLISSGYAGMTVEAIAKEAGVSTQTVYAVFGSKRGIMAELLDRVIYIDHFH